MDDNISLNVKCTKCNHSLMDHINKMHAKPSIRVLAKNEKNETGYLWLCSTYGCYDKQSDIELPANSNVEVFCPHCNEMLNTGTDCKCDGNGKMIKFNIDIGGVVSICSRVGCKNHYVMVDDLDVTLRRFHREYGY